MFASLVGLILPAMFWLAGVAVFSAFFVQPLSGLRFGIPVTRFLRQEGLLSSGNSVLLRQTAAVGVQWTLLIAASLGLYVLFPGYLITYLVGGGIALAVGVGKTGYDEANLENYLRAHERHFLASKYVVRGLVASRFSKQQR